MPNGPRREKNRKASLHSWLSEPGGDRRNVSESQMSQENCTSAYLPVDLHWQIYKALKKGYVSIYISD